MTSQSYSTSICRALLACLILSLMVNLTFAEESATAIERQTFTSPNGKLTFNYWLQNGRFTFSVARSDKIVIEPSELVFSIDGIDLTKDVQIGSVTEYELNERFPWRGVHSVAVNHCRGLKIPLTHVPSGEETIFEVRVFNDGVAYRHMTPDNGQTRVPDETSRFVLPEGSRAWFHDLESHYEGQYDCQQVEQIASGQWLAPPVTFELPQKTGYVAISEAALTGYSGMALQADGDRGFRMVLGHDQPVSYPFRLRYEEDIERLKQPAEIKGEIVTPWRVILVSADLNGLVNSDIIPSCCPPPDPELFPEGLATSWLRPGRAVWKYLDGGENTIEEVERFSEWAGQLGFEYQVVEGFWRDWSDQQIRDLVEFSKEKGVELWFWRHSRALRTPEARKEFFSRLSELGVVGAKIDFFDHEHLEVVNHYEELLEEAARHQILVNFHGANKTTGLERTWPNEMIREGVRGAEYRKPPERARHNAILPFTRYLVGHGDYTPVIFGQRRYETSWAHQIATAVVFTQPLLTYGSHPEKLLKNPAKEVICSIPSVWDETIALPESEIGEIVAFARRQGDQWFLALLNGGEERSISIPLEFLDGEKYMATLVQDRASEQAAVDIEERRIARDEVLDIKMSAAGGFVARFVPINQEEDKIAKSFSSED